MDGPATLFQEIVQKRESRRLQIHEFRLRLIEQLRDRLKINPRSSSLYIQLAALHAQLQQLEHGVAVLQEGLNQCEPSVDLYREAIFTSAEANRTDAALELLQQAKQLFPHVKHFQLWE